MNDFLNNKKEKIKVAYVTNNKEPSRSSSHKKRKTPSRPSPSATPSQSSRIEKSIGSVWKTHFKQEDQPCSFEQKSSSPTQQIDAETIRKQKLEEAKLYGEKVCQTLFNQRPESIVKGYFLQPTTPKFKKALSWMATHRKSYHVVTEQEMQKITSTTHHEGVCFIVKKRPLITVNDYLTNHDHTAKDAVIIIHQIDNPYNIGAILRSAAFFGVQAVLLDNPQNLETGSIARTASGGAEYLHALTAPDLTDALQQFKQAGYQLIGLSELGDNHSAIPFQQANYQAKSVFIVSSQSQLLKPFHIDFECAIHGKHDGLQLNIAAAMSLLLAKWSLH